MLLSRSQAHSSFSSGRRLSEGRNNSSSASIAEAAASIDAGQLAISPTQGDTFALLTEAADMFRAVASSKGQSVQVDSPPGPLFALFDHDRRLQEPAGGGQPPLLYAAEWRPDGNPSLNEARKGARWLQRVLDRVLKRRCCGPCRT